MLDCHHLHKGFPESAPACPCTAPSAKFHPRHQVLEGTTALCISFTCPSTEGAATAVPGDTWTSLCWCQYALGSLPTELHPAGTAATLLGCFGVRGFSLLQGIISTSIGKDWQQKTDMELPNRSIQGCTY